MEDKAIRTATPQLRVKVRYEWWRKGKLLERWEGGDLVGSFGRDWLCAKVAGALAIGTPAGGGKGTLIKYSAIGTGAAAPTTGQSALIAPIYRGTFPYSKDSAVGSASLDRSFSIGSTYAMRESGLFVQKVGGTMYSRGTYAVKNVASGDTITVRYTLGFAI